MPQVEFRVSASDIKRAVHDRIKKPVEAVGKDNAVMRQIADKALEIVEPYVPWKHGYLTKSGHVVQHARKTEIKWGKPSADPKDRTMIYADYQHNNLFRHRTRTVHPLAQSFWTRKIMPGSRGYSKLVTYATPIVKKEVKKNGGR